jgi:hypothetical protein
VSDDFASVDARIAANRRRFDELVGRAEDRLARGRSEQAAVHAQVAAALAWHSPTGRFASPRLESVLIGVAQEELAVPRANAGRTGKRTVLHILTTAYQFGGHTRLAWRWMERDDASVHSVALTRQGYEPIPAALEAAVGARGGHVWRTDRAAPDLIGRAASLQIVAAAADVVVLHAHPFDVVPMMALAGLGRDGRRPPTMLLNHADHLFWVGIAEADLVLHLRTSGARLSLARRGLSPERSALLPVPLSRVEGQPRSPTGWGHAPAERGVTAVSVASGYKFGSGNGGFLPLLERLVARIPDLRIIVVGPGDRDPWRGIERRTAGRIRASGPIGGITEIYKSADLYLDSYPFSSLTSMLEAGQRGIPLVAYSDTGPDADVVAFDDPATDGLDVRVGSTEAYLAAVGRLVDDPAWRRERGRTIQEAIAAEHEGARWRDRLEDAYRKAETLHATPGHAPAVGQSDAAPSTAFDLDRRLMALLDAQQEEGPAGVRGHLRFAPFAVRLEEWRRARRSARPLSLAVLLPERALMLGRRAGILARTARRVVRRRAS